MAVFDVTHLPFPDHCFDAIYASHVLEHVREDRCAMSELARVLKSEGWAILQVPIDVERETTYEDPSIADPVDRKRIFGHPEHVRIYGIDYQTRLEEAGFTVTRDEFARQISPSEIHRLSLCELEDIYLCKKR
jgi:ubiquinone/menaquinone biosynthesis C-methylase UbiE